MPSMMPMDGFGRLKPKDLKKVSRQNANGPKKIVWRGMRSDTPSCRHDSHLNEFAFGTWPGRRTVQRRVGGFAGEVTCSVLVPAKSVAKASADSEYFRENK